MYELIYIALIDGEAGRTGAESATQSVEVAKCADELSSPLKICSREHPLTRSLMTTCCVSGM